MYADLADQDTGLGARIGRQRMNSSGVLSRFDGARLSWQVSPDWRVNLMSGEPIYSTSRRAESDRNFYGLSVDAFDLAGVFDASMYYNTQEVDGITDREAVGGELRYYNARASLVSSIDYDAGYNTLNNFVVLGNWAFDDRLTFNARYDFRRSPYMLSENALIGQGVGSIDELRSLFSDDEIRELAEARSGEATTITLGLSRPLFERFQVNADVTMSDYSGTAATDGVAAITDLGAEYYYNLNFVGSSLLTEGDSTIFTLRYIDGSTSSTVSAAHQSRGLVTMPRQNDCGQLQSNV